MNLLFQPRSRYATKRAHRAEVFHPLSHVEKYLMSLLLPTDCVSWISHPTSMWPDSLSRPRCTSEARKRRWRASPTISSLGQSCDCRGVVLHHPTWRTTLLRPHVLIIEGISHKDLGITLFIHHLVKMTHRPMNTKYALPSTMLLPVLCAICASSQEVEIMSSKRKSSFLRILLASGRIY